MAAAHRGGIFFNPQGQPQIEVALRSRNALRGAALGSGERAQREVESVQFADEDKKVLGREYRLSGAVDGQQLLVVEGSLAQLARTWLT